MAKERLERWQKEVNETRELLKQLREVDDKDLPAVAQEMRERKEEDEQLDRLFGELLSEVNAVLRHTLERISSLHVREGKEGGEASPSD
jgi:preprotein translocase subunit SecA